MRLHKLFESMDNGVGKDLLHGLNDQTGLQFELIDQEGTPENMTYVFGHYPEDVHVYVTVDQEDQGTRSKPWYEISIETPDGGHETLASYRVDLANASQLFQGNDVYQIISTVEQYVDESIEESPHWDSHNTDVRPEKGAGIARVQQDQLPQWFAVNKQTRKKSKSKWASMADAVAWVMSRGGKQAGWQIMSEDGQIVEDNDPCWKNYKMVGMKKKNGKEVPNCVPKESVNEAGEDWDPVHVEIIDAAIGRSTIALGYVTKSESDPSPSRGLVTTTYTNKGATSGSHVFIGLENAGMIPDGHEKTHARFEYKGNDVFVNTRLGYTTISITPQSKDESVQEASYSDWEECPKSPDGEHHFFAGECEYCGEYHPDHSMYNGPGSGRWGDAWDVDESVNEGSGFDWLDADQDFITWALDKGFSDEDYQELKDVIASDYDEAGQPQSFAQHNPDMMAQVLQTYFSHLYPDMKRRYDAVFGESAQFDEELNRLRKLSGLSEAGNVIDRGSPEHQAYVAKKQALEKQLNQMGKDDPQYATVKAEFDALWKNTTVRNAPRPQSARSQETDGRYIGGKNRYTGD